MKSVLGTTIFLFTFLVTVNSQHPDLPALKALYEATDGENWTNNNGWEAGVNDPDGNPCDGWYGVECENNRLTRITLGSNNLVGFIPSEIGTLIKMERLNLERNDLEGSIPDSMGNLENLEYLNLQFNELGGILPASLGNILGFRSFNIGGNNFSGQLPEFFGQWTELLGLYLHRNNFSGELPQSLENYTKLQNMILNENNFSGQLFHIVEKLPKLSSLNVERNNFEGTIPKNILDATNLNSINLSYNKFTGEIPGALGNQSFYNYLELNNNDFGGCFDPKLYSFCGNDKVDFRNNSKLPWRGDLNQYCLTSGSEEDQLGAPCYLTGFGSLTINDNCECAPSCDHPDYFALVRIYSNTVGSGWSKRDGWKEGAQDQNCDPCTWYGVTCNEEGRVISLGLNSNNLRGSIPKEIGQLTELEQLGFANNSIGGSLPDEIYGLSLLKGLNLGGNNIYGIIKEDIGAFTQLQSLGLYGNNLSGDLPSSIGMLSDLTTLTLSDNQITGSIPNEFVNLTKLTTLHIERNDLSGPLPNDIGNLSLMRSLRLQGNKLSGTIPASLGDLDSLYLLYLQDNNFTGCFDENLYNLCDVIELRMSNNTGLAWNGDFDQFCMTSGNTGEQEGVYCGLGGSGMIDNCECIVSNELCFTPNSILCQQWVRDLVNSMDCYDFGFGQWASFSLALSNYEDKPVLVVNQGGGFASKVYTSNSVYTCDGELLETCFYSLGVGCGDSTTIYSQLFPNPTTFYRCQVDTLPDCSMFNQHPDYPALSALYKGTNGLNWEAQIGWREGIQDPFRNPCDGWEGIECDENDRVVSLDLRNNNMSGQLPDEIGDLDALVNLDLSINLMKGPLPESLGNLKNLKYFNAYFNFFEALHSTLGEMESLEYFSVNLNLIESEIPEDIGNLIHLKTLDLAKNRFFGGIPNSITNLTNLVELNLFLNKLTGELPEQIGAMGSLEIISLANNNLSGEIPLSIVSLAKLKSLFLLSNSFSGELPLGMVSSSSFKNLNISDNNFTGSLPDGFYHTQSILQFELRNNNFSGCIPESYLGFCMNNKVDLNGNPLLPYSGNLEDYCLNDADQIGAPCDDGDDSNGINDLIQDDCSCAPMMVANIDIEESLISIYPNPVHNILQIAYEGGEILSYTISDMMGKTFQRGHFVSGEIELTTAPKGLLIIEIIDSKRNFKKAFKLIKI